MAEQRHVITIGLDELLRDLEHAQNIDQTAQELLYDYGVQAQQLAQAYAPVDTGALRASITVRTLDGGDTVEISPDVPYEVYVEFGTGQYSEFGGHPYVIEPKDAQALRFMVRGEWVFAKRVVHPGIRPQPYMRPAAENIAEALVLAAGNHAVGTLMGDAQ